MQYHQFRSRANGQQCRALALAVALGTRLAAPAHHEHVTAARRTALGEAHALVEAARARVRPVHIELDRHRDTADAEPNICRG